MIEKGNRYVHGSTAEKLQYDVYQENKVLKAKKRYRNNNKAKLKTICYVMMLFLACLTVIYRYAMITELNYKIAKINKSYNELRNENTRLKVEIDKETDLNKIRAAAESRLGMQRPDKYQIVYVNVPKIDFTETVETNTPANNTKSDMFAIVWNKMGRLTHLLY